MESERKEDTGKNLNGPVQILKGEDGTFSLCENNLSNILMTEGVKDTKVVVVSVTGAFRKGKSFLLSWFLRYLSSTRGENWMEEGDDELKGFKWKGGLNRETDGIWMWGKPFLRKLKTGENVAILLMDFQGTFDNKTTVKENNVIFGLSTLLSSLQVYNISQQLKDDDLQHLQYFTKLARLNMESDSSVKPFQRLEILIRDWQNECDYELGREGGKKYLKHVLKITGTHPEDKQSVRKHIDNCFEEVGCYLLPYPGRKVASKPDFKGRVSDMEPDFVHGLRKLVPLYLSDSCLKPKRVGVNVLKGEDLFQHFKGCLEALKQVLEPKAENDCMNALLRAQKKYEDEMHMRLRGGEDYKKLYKHHKESKTIAMKVFNEECGDTKLSEQYRQELKKYMDEHLERYENYQDSWNNEAGIMMMKNSLKPVSGPFSGEQSEPANSSSSILCSTPQPGEQDS